MRHRFPSVLWILTLIFAPALAVGDDASTGKKLDLSFVPDDAVAAVVARPQRMLTGPQAEMYPTEVISAATEKQVGFDPLEIEQGMMVIGLPDPTVTTGSRDPRGGFVLWFSKPIEMADVAAKIVPRGSDADLEGRKARISENSGQFSCAFADDHTLVIAPESGLRWMLSAKQGDGDLRKLLSAADDSPDVAAYLVMAPLRPLLAPALAQAAGQLPPPLAGLTKVPDLMDTLTAEASQNEQGLLHLQVTATSPDEKAAQELEGLLKQSLEIARNMFLAQMSNSLAQRTESRSGGVWRDDALSEAIERKSGGHTEAGAAGESGDHEGGNNGRAGGRRRADELVVARRASGARGGGPEYVAKQLETNWPGDLEL